MGIPGLTNNYVQTAAPSDAIIRGVGKVHIASGAGGNAAANYWPGITVSKVSVGINCNAPAYTLDVCGNANISGRIRLYEATGTSTVTSTANTLPTPLTPANGIGTLTLTHDNSGGASSIVFRSGVNPNSDYGFITYIDDVSNETNKERSRLLIGTRDDPTDAQWIDATVLQPWGGYVGIGQMMPAYVLDVSGAGRFTSNVSATDFIASSDRRLKTEITTISNALDIVKELRGVYFTRHGEATRSVGVVAQEVETILPEVVHTGPDGMRAVSYGNIAGVLIEAIKTLSEKLEKISR